MDPDASTVDEEGQLLNPTGGVAATGCVLRGHRVVRGPGPPTPLEAMRTALPPRRETNLGTCSRAARLQLILVEISRVSQRVL